MTSLYTPHGNHAPGELVVATGAATALKAVAPARRLTDGVADEKHINAALAALPSGGGTVTLSEGTFNIAAAVTLNTDDRLVGQGTGTIVKGATGVTNMLLGATGALRFAAEDMTIDGNSLNSLAGLHLVSNQYCRFKGLRLINFGGTSCVAVRLEAAGTTNTVANEFWATVIDTATVGLQLDGLSAAVVTNNTLFGLKIVNVSGTGIRLAQWADSNYYYGCWIDLTTNNAFGIIHNDSATPAASVGVYNNQFWGLSIDSFGITGATGILFNETKQNYVFGFFHSPEVFNGTLINDNSGRSDSHRIFNAQRDAAENSLEEVTKGTYGGLPSVTVTEAYTSTLFDAVGLTDSKAVWTQPANSILVGVSMRLDTQFAATSMTDLDITIGDAGDPDGLLAPGTHNLTSDAAATEYRTKGAYFDATAGTLVKEIATAWTAYVTAVGANLSTLTAGKVIFTFTYIQY